MRVTCPKCKSVQSVDDKTATCTSCRTVLRRCADCAHYDVRGSLCNAVNRLIAPGESHYPLKSAESGRAPQSMP
jgi:phage FluMu protein Com